MCLYVDLDCVQFQDDLRRFDVDAEPHGVMFQELLAKSFHYPWIHGQGGARRGSIRRFGVLPQLEDHHREGAVGVQTTIMCFIVMLLFWY